MTKDLIRYDLQVQNALKGVVRKVLSDAARDGLPGDHHFYISFRTRAPGVRLSQHLRDTYPEEMTIVLQHQFWDLGVTEHAFEVGLSFKGIPERLLVPFDAISGFFDPSVQFGLRFDTGEGGDIVVQPDPDGEKVRPSLPAKPGRGSVPAVAPAARERTGKDADAGGEPAAATGRGKPSKKSDKADKAAADSGSGGDQSATVVSLDAFRKK